MNMRCDLCDGDVSMVAAAIMIDVLFLSDMPSLANIADSEQILFFGKMLGKADIIKRMNSIHRLIDREIKHDTFQIGSDFPSA